MKKALRKWILMAFLLAGVLGINTSNAQGSVSLQVFYDELQPYGNWMTYGNYGYVWVPNVGRDFTPYATNGYWINTEYGNTWVSDYSWGWAPFHYGRWLYDDFYGWVWVPDTEWGPAWVAWRSGGGYYGWAPLMPGINISVSYNYYNTIPNHYWSFVPYRYITYRTVHHHCVPRPQVINIINHTTIVTHNHYDSRSRRTYFTGPSRSEIERVNHERVEVYRVNDRSRPGRSDIDRGTVSIYRPRIENDHGRNTPAPSRVVHDEHSRNQREVLESRNDRSAEFERFRSNREGSSRDERTNENDNKIERLRQPVEHGEPQRNNPSERPQTIDGRSMNRESDRQREMMNRDQERVQQQRSPMLERKPESRPAQREYSPQHDQPRTFDRPQQRSVDPRPENHSQQERPSMNRSEPSRSQPSREHSSPNMNRSEPSRSQPSREHSSPNMNRNEPSRSQPQREQQMRRSSEHQNSQPSRSPNHSRKHD